MNRGDIFKCSMCGAVVEVNVWGGGFGVCCGKQMTLLEANKTDAAGEKHVPVIEKKGDGYLIKVGSVLHPMTDEHHIQFIEIITETGKSYKQFLEHNSKPEAFFEKIPEKKFKVREYCNLHGVWETEYKSS